MYRQDNDKTVEQNRGGDVDDDGTGDDVRHLALDRRRGKLPNNPTVFRQVIAVGDNAMAGLSAPYSASRA